MKRLPSPIPTITQTVRFSAYFFILMCRKKTILWMGFLTSWMARTTGRLLTCGLVSNPVTKAPKASMRESNTFTTHSDLQVIFIHGSKKVLIECSKSFVERYDLDYYVLVMTYDEFKAHLHGDDVSKVNVYGYPVSKEEETRFRVRLPGLKNYVQFFSRGYYDLEGGRGFLAFDVSHVSYLKEQLQLKDIEYANLVEERRLVLNYGKDIVTKLSLEGEILDVSDEALKVFNSTRKNVVGQNIYHLDDVLKNGQDWLQEALDKKQLERRITHFVNQKRVIIDWVVDVIEDDVDEPLYFLVVGREVTDLIEINEQLRREKNYDRLTGALSPVGLIETLNQQRLDEALFYIIRLEQIHSYRDYYGQPFINYMLKDLYERLYLVSTHQFKIARKDEQTFILVAQPHANADGIIAHLIHDYQTDSISIFKVPLTLHVHVGKAHYPSDGKTFEAVIGKAFLASSHAKTGHIKVYHPKMTETLTHNMQLLERMQLGLQNDAFSIHFQEIHDTNRQQVLFIEALARWQDNVHGMIPPDEFIAKARQANFLHRLEAHLIEKALVGFKEAKSISKYKATKLCLNITRETLLEDGFVSNILLALNSVQLRPNDVVIEISENTFIHDTALCESRTIELHKKGFLIALDDFGKEFSSLAILENLPIDYLKIDAIFTRKINQALQKEIIIMIKRLAQIKQADVIVEGVETLAQSALLKTLGIHLQQGYYWHIPKVLI